MRIHYRDELRVICNAPSSRSLVSTQEPRKVTCQHCLREMPKGIQTRLEVAAVYRQSPRPRAIFAKLARR